MALHRIASSLACIFLTGIKQLYDKTLHWETILLALLPPEQLYVSIMFVVFILSQCLYLLIVRQVSWGKCVLKPPASFILHNWYMQQLYTLFQIKCAINIIIILPSSWNNTPPSLMRHTIFTSTKKWHLKSKLKKGKWSYTFTNISHFHTPVIILLHTSL